MLDEEFKKYKMFQ